MVIGGVVNVGGQINVNGGGRLMAKEVRIPYSEINDSQTITRVNERKFKEQGLDIHRHEVEKIEDDHGRQERVLKIKNTKYYGPWSKRG
jgi:hypothetical protein